MTDSLFAVETEPGIENTPECGASGGCEPTLDSTGFVRVQDAMLQAETCLFRPVTENRNIEWPFPGWKRYHFQRFLGQGAMGLVFQVLDPLLGRAVAFKVLHGKGLDCGAGCLEEARAQARVDHPNVAKVHEVGEVQGRPYLTMQLLRGQSLFAARDRLCLEERVEMIRQACDGVHAAHTTGLLHLDIKPGNIVVEKDEDGRLRAFVVDFGMACGSSVPGSEEAADASSACMSDIFAGIKGTPAFMSPEQASGDALDCRSDVFSLGTTLYAVLTGRLPFMGQSAFSTLGKVRLIRPDSARELNAAIPKDLEAIVLRAMEKDPDRRYPSAMALGQDLKRWLDGEVVSALEEKFFYRLGRWMLKNRALAAALGLLFFILLGVTLWGGRVRRRMATESYYHQFLGQAAERMEASLFLAESMPCQDTHSERDSIRLQMEAIRTSMVQGGEAAEAPGFYALGRGYLALEQWDDGRRALERAWELGLQTPEVGFSLGFCLGKVYQNALSGLHGAIKAARKGELDRTLKPLISFYLAKAREGSRKSMVTFAEALLARAEGRHAEALAKADLVLESQPWKVQAVLLKAGIHYDLADEERPGTVHLDRAKSLLLQAKTMARSCSAVYELEAQVYLREMVGAIFARKAFKPHMEALLGATKKAREVNSRSWISYAVEAEGWVWTRDGSNSWFWTRPEDEKQLPSIMRQAIDCADKALNIEPAAFSAIRAKGTAYWRLALWEMQHDLDPGPKLEQAIQTFSQTIAKHGSLFDLVLNLGNCYVIKGDWEMNKGVDPLRSYGKALDCYKRAEAIKYEPFLDYNRAILLMQGAVYDRWQGRDSRPRLEAALRAVRKSIAGKWGPAENTFLATLYLQMAEDSAWQGKPDMKAFRQGRQYAAQVRAAAPDDPEALQVFAWAGLLKSFISGGESDLGESEKALKRAVHSRPGNPEIQFKVIWLELERFRKSPSKVSYRALEERIDRALKNSSAKPNLHFLAFDACRCAAASAGNGPERRFWLREMQERVSLAKRMHPQLAPEADRLWQEVRLKS